MEEGMKGGRNIGFATFRYPHNYIKVLTWLLLDENTPARRLSLKQIAEVLGHYYYLKAKLGEWVRWGYLSRRVGIAGGRPVYQYKITPKGRRYLSEVVPPEVIIECNKKIQGYQNEQAARARQRLKIAISTYQAASRRKR